MLLKEKYIQKNIKTVCEGCFPLFVFSHALLVHLSQHSVTRNILGEGNLALFFLTVVISSSHSVDSGMRIWSLKHISGSRRHSVLLLNADTSSAS